MADILVIRFDAKKAAAKLEQLTRLEQKMFEAAVANSMRDAGKEIWTRVDKDIARAGKFSERWPAAFVVHNQMMGPNALMQVGFSSAIPYAHVHEFGATIRGKPLLWIPLPWNPFKRRAREYPGKLFRVNRGSRNPLLFSAEDKTAKYVGVTHVTLRPRFHIRSIVANVVRTKLSKLFARYVKGVKL